MNGVHVYIIQTSRPWLAAACFLAHLKTTASGATWASPDRLNGKRFKVGSTAFLTMEAAEKRRLGLCARNLQAPRVDVAARIGFEGTVQASAGAHPPKVFVSQIVTT